jgi:hypothetical protein
LVAVPKTAISEVSIEGRDGRVVGAARLGQQSGYRALCISGGKVPSALSEIAQIADMAPTNEALSVPVDVPEIEGDPVPMVDIPMTPMDPIGAEGGGIPLSEQDIPMAAMPMDIEMD